MRQIAATIFGPSLYRGASHRFFRLLGGWVLSVAWVVTQQLQFPPWAVMWLLAGMVFAACKRLSWLRLEEPSALAGSRLLGYLLLWPGMRPQPFLAGPDRTHTNLQKLFVTGSIK